jgi:hypothetical protein
MEYELNLSKEAIEGLTNAFSTLWLAGFRGCLTPNSVFLLFVNGKQYEVYCKIWEECGGNGHTAKLRVWDGLKSCYLPEINFYPCNPPRKEI